MPSATSTDTIFPAGGVSGTGTRREASSLSRSIGRSNELPCGRGRGNSQIRAPLVVSPGIFLGSVFAAEGSRHAAFRLSSERTLAIRAKRKNWNKGGGRRGGGKPEPGPLANEHLVAEVLKRGDGAPAGDLMVRLVIDRGAGEPSEIDVVSLVAAIETSQELGVDLVAVNLDQDVPVVKAADLNRLKYELSKKSGPAKTPTSSQVKEFKFKAGIDDNDLQRKVTNLMKYLDKGHTCKITVTSNRKNLMRDNAAVVTTLDRVREIVGDLAVEPRALRGNERGTHAVITFQPNPKARTKK